jgi:hypothetical protein
MDDALTNRCPEHSDPFDCPDALICFSAERGYGLIIHDGGRSFIGIAFCPWCGARIGKARD